MYINLIEIMNFCIRKQNIGQRNVIIQVNMNTLFFQNLFINKKTILVNVIASIHGIIVSLKNEGYPKFMIKFEQNT